MIAAASSWNSAITLGVLVVTVIFFIRGKLRSDMVAFCAMLTLVLTGVLTPEEGLSGFSNSVILTIAGMFVIGGAIVRTGLAGVISGRILAVAGSSQNLLFMLVMLITALVGSLVSNTGTVAIMMPIVVSMAMTLKISPSRFLMPLAFMAGMGGLLTLIGNPPNMVVNDVYVKAGFEALTLLSFLPVGVVAMVFGMFVLAPVTSYFLARRKGDKGEDVGKAPTLKDLVDKYNLMQRAFKIGVREGAELAGKSLRELALTGRFGMVVQEVRREKKGRGSLKHRHAEEQLVPGPETVLKAGDVLVCLGTHDRAKDMVEACGLEFMGDWEAEDERNKYRFDAIGICELVLMSSSRLVKRKVSESGLREQFGATLLGIQRGDQYIVDDIKNQVMQSGDALLVQGSWESLDRLADFSSHWVVVGRPQNQIGKSSLQRKIPFVSLVILLMIAGMALGLLPTVAAVLLAAVAVILGGCYPNVEEAYRSVNWETLVMIACMLPMARAMEKAGLVGAAAEYMTILGRGYGPHLALIVVYFATSAMNIVISSTPVALLVAPVALQLALDLQVSPLPFMFAVATSACMCFASPFSTPANALVMSAGRYTFMDYLKIGLPLQILMGIVMVIALPLLFPF
ncbi:MAG: SLC13 family permease [Deltaproteobacteria bacterium]|jgi:di/tricarboxylate transporter|nr:SLC13 family permease [Deltaproteobacteria bacterium]